MLKSRIWAIHRTTSLERIGSPLIEPLVKMLQRGSAPLGRFCGTGGRIRDTGARSSDRAVIWAVYREGFFFEGFSAFC